MFRTTQDRHPWCPFRWLIWNPLIWPVISTLHFLSEHARRYGVTPVLTFDQPLWWKATTSVDGAQEDSPLRSVILRLGGFHILMIFLGSIGHLTAGTGLPVFNMYWKSYSLETQLSAYSVEKLSQAPSMVTSFLSLSFIHFCMQTRGAHPFRTSFSHTPFWGAILHPG